MKSQAPKPKLSDFDYTLPQGLIAAYPPKERTSARLLVGGRKSGEFSHHIFSELEGFLNAGDVLVLNNTRVIPARLLGKRRTGGQVEAFLLEKKEEGQWEALLRPGGRIRKEDTITFEASGDTLQAQVLDEARANTGQRRIRFLDENADEKIQRIGHMPLPPYIQRPDEEVDRELYQTVFAKEEGAVASPTAGLHFDQELLEKLQVKGVEIVYVTLHVSYGTFQPVQEEDLEKHQMFEESYEIKEEAAEKINQALKEGRRLVACGTTSVRTLESAVGEDRQVRAGKAKTRLFVYPPYDFKVVGALITNFHLPKSTLLCLVSAFSGHQNLFRFYEEAIREQYRFYSYGDAMLIQ